VKNTSKLVLCAGPYDYGEGYTTLDVTEDCYPDYLAHLPPIPKELMTGEWKEIYLIHGIEHFHHWDALELIKNIYDALAPGGFAVFEQPNFKVCAEVYLGLRGPIIKDEPAEISGIRGIFGDHTSGNPYLNHLWGWVPETLKEAIVSCGFSEEKVKVGKALSRPFIVDRDFRIEATK
jgi:hypothetical protein